MQRLCAHVYFEESGAYSNSLLKATTVEQERGWYTWNVPNSFSPASLVTIGLDCGTISYSFFDPSFVDLASPGATIDSTDGTIDFQNGFPIDGIHFVDVEITESTGIALSAFYNLDVTVDPRCIIMVDTTWPQTDLGLQYNMYLN